MEIKHSFPVITPEIKKDLVDWSLDLAEKYQEVCRLCHAKHKALYGVEALGCAWCSFESCFCPEISSWEQRQKGVEYEKNG